MVYHGIGVSPVISMGKALILVSPAELESLSYLSEEERETELVRFIDSQKQLSQEYDEKIALLKTEGKKEQSAILGAHKSILNDPLLKKEIERNLSENRLDAPSAVKLAVDGQIDMLRKISNPYMQARMADLADVGKRLVSALMGVPLQSLAAITEQTVLVAQDIAPSDMATMNPQTVRGIVTVRGSKTAHTSILANNMGIAAVVGCADCNDLKDGDLIFVDGIKGIAERINDPEREKELRAQIEDFQKEQQALEAYREAQTITADGEKLLLCANIMEASCPPRLMDTNPDGIGLFRTEFLFMDRAVLPTEDEQYAAYLSVAKKFQNKDVIIRTIDIGGDKKAACLNLEKEENPFLGYRAIRICLDREELFLTQLRALVRANEFGNIMIMYPMISSLAELTEAKLLLKKAINQLKEEGKPVNEKIRQGIMIEVPSAALMADILIEHCDFFSIGSNDLTQYTLAVDRMNPKVSHLYSHFDPAVLKLIQMTISAARNSEKLCGMCGEMASDPLAVPLLIGMGLKELSVNSSSLLSTRKLLVQTSVQQMAELSKEVLKLDTAQAVRSFLESRL